MLDRSCNEWPRSQVRVSVNTLRGGVRLPRRFNRLLQRRKILWYSWAPCRQYNDRLIGHASASFLNLVQTGERIEDLLKTGKIKIIRLSLSNLPVGQVGPLRRVSLKGRMINETDIHAISAPAACYLQSYAPPAPIYQLAAPSPPTPTYPPYILHTCLLSPATLPIQPLQIISIIRIVSKVTPKGIQEKLPKVLLPWLNHTPIIPEVVQLQYHCQDPTSGFVALPQPNRALCLGLGSVSHFHRLFSYNHSSS